MAVELVKSNIVLDKPIYTGVAILDFAKQHMSSFWYGSLKKRYGSRVQLCFTGNLSIHNELIC